MLGDAIILSRSCVAIVPLARPQSSFAYVTSKRVLAFAKPSSMRPRPRPQQMWPEKHQPKTISIVWMWVRASKCSIRQCCECKCSVSILNSSCFCIKCFSSSCASRFGLYNNGVMAWNRRAHTTPLSSASLLPTTQPEQHQRASNASFSFLLVVLFFIFFFFFFWVRIRFHFFAEGVARVVFARFSVQENFRREKHIKT